MDANASLGTGSRGAGGAAAEPGRAGATDALRGDHAAQDRGGRPPALAQLAASLAGIWATPAPNPRSSSGGARRAARRVAGPAEVPAGDMPTAPGIGHANVSLPPTPLIGRAADVAAVCALLRRSTCAC